MGSVNDVVHFGKYEGKTILEILKIDPDYLNWVLSETCDLGPFLSNGSYYDFPFRELREYGYIPPQWVTLAYDERGLKWIDDNYEQIMKDSYEPISGYDPMGGGFWDDDGLYKDWEDEIGEVGYWNID